MEVLNVNCSLLYTCILRPNSHNGALLLIDLIRLRIACFLYLDVEFKALVVSHLSSSHVRVISKEIRHKYERRNERRDRPHDREIVGFVKSNAR